jgi:predicted amidohydrolase
MEHIANFAKLEVGHAWSSDEECKLKRELCEMESCDHDAIVRIAHAHGRTVQGIISRAKRLHLETYVGLRAKDRAKWGLYREGLIDYAEYTRESVTPTNPDL